MKKAIRMNIVVWVEGEAEPVQNFALFATHALREIISKGNSVVPSLDMRIESIHESANRPDEEVLL